MLQTVQVLVGNVTFLCLFLHIWAALLATWPISRYTTNGLLCCACLKKSYVSQRLDLVSTKFVANVMDIPYSAYISRV